MAEDHVNQALSDDALFSFVQPSAQSAQQLHTPGDSYWRGVWRMFCRKKSNLFLLFFLGVLLIFTYLYPTVIGYDAQTDPYIHLLDPTAKHLRPAAAMEKFGSNIHWILGTGASGQSTFDAVWYGARISVSLALVCAAINLTVGVLVGAVWGFSKKVDLFMTELYNICSNVPYILIVSVVVLILSSGFFSMVFALTVTGWLSIAWFIRTQVILLRDREYNLASRCLGTPIVRMAVRNILPYMTSVIVTLAAAEIPSYISYEVFLSYIGLGLQDMSLGRLIEASQSAMFTPGWELEFWSPVAVASVITVVLYVVGQNLGDAADPRTHL